MVEAELRSSPTPVSFEAADRPHTKSSAHKLISVKIPILQHRKSPISTTSRADSGNHSRWYVCMLTAQYCHTPSDSPTTSVRGVFARCFGSGLKRKLLTREFLCSLSPSSSRTAHITGEFNRYRCGKLSHIDDAVVASKPSQSVVGKVKPTTTLASDSSRKLRTNTMHQNIDWSSASPTGTSSAKSLPRN